MARSIRTLALAGLPLVIALQAHPPGEEAEATNAAISTAAEAMAQQLIGGGRRSESDTSMCAMLPDLEKGRNLRVGSVPNATLSECRLCMMHPEGSPKLWILESSDGVGTRIHNMIMGMAVAAKNGMNIAGFVSIPFECPVRVYHGFPYGVDVKRVYDFFFGLNSTDLFVNRRQPHVAKYRNMRALEKDTTDVMPLGIPDPLAPGAQSILDESDILMQFSGLRNTRREIQHYITKDFISTLRAMASNKAVMERPLWFAGDGRPTVAVHIRRGDVKQRGINQFRWSPDFWYMDKIQRIRHQLPDADVHVFTSVDEDTDQRSLNIYRSAGCHVHTDEDRAMASHAVMDAWAHIARADFVILSRSSFGHVPAMLNTNCVIYQEYWNAPMDGWIWAENSDKGSSNMFDMGAFNTCIRRIARPSWGIMR